MKYILGLSISHDATAILIDANGSVVLGFAEERLTRIKYHETFPYLSVKKIMEMSNISSKDLVEVVYNWEDLGGKTYKDNIFAVDSQHIDWANVMPIKIRFSLLLDKILKRKSEADSNYVRKALASCNIRGVPIRSFNHQLTHISSAYFSSGIDDCLVMSLDGYGDKLSGAVYLGKNGKLDKFLDGQVLI